MSRGSAEAEQSAPSRPLATTLLYQQDESLRTHTTRLIGLWRYSELPDLEQTLFRSFAAGHDNGTDCFVLETDETIFYVQSGGQPFDKGWMKTRDSKFIVEAVRHGIAGRVLHFGTFATGHPEQLQGGEAVEQRIDGKRRDLHGQIHTAGHIIGLAVRRLAEKHRDLDVTEMKASNLPNSAYVEFKGLIDDKFLGEIQSQVADDVKQALPVKVSWVKQDQLAMERIMSSGSWPLVRAADDKIRVVNIIGAGTYSCGGSHVQDTSLVGTIVVRSINREQGISKIFYNIDHTTPPESLRKRKLGRSGSSLRLLGVIGVVLIVWSLMKRHTSGRAPGNRV